MKKKRRNALRLRYLTISKIALIVMAAMRLYSIWISANSLSQDMISLIQQNLQYNLLFMISMFDILCSLSLFRIQKQMGEGIQLERNMGVLYIITITQIIFMNPIISILLLVAVYSLKEQLYFSFKGLFKNWIKKENRIQLLSTAIFCIFFSCYIYMSMNVI